MQARWRCHKAVSYYKRLKRGAVVTQTGWRCRVARRELRLLKMVSIVQCFIYRALKGLSFPCVIFNFIFATY
jgi:hypothetical protein